jgi:protein-S-isoprenylcysteine O-methyltransferase Ste14
VVISRKSILKPGSHGFYRFFAWEGMLWMFIANARFWFDDPFSLWQIVSWLFLFISLYLLITSVLQFGMHGKAHHSRDDQVLLSFEKTTRLIETGIYRYIRHPMYSSLLFLAWGIFLKHPSAGLSGVALLTTVMLLETALVDEKECKAYFGEAYIRYMLKTKRFIPFVF